MSKKQSTKYGEKMSKEIFKIAKQRFLSENTDIQNELDNLKSEAKALSIDFDDYKELKLTQIFNEHAKKMGVDPFELTLQLGTFSEEKRQELRLIQAKNKADSLGISWGDYIELNPKWK